MLTKLEARKIYEANSENLKLKFYSYYKYTFTFMGDNGIIKVYAKYGGNKDDIYRLEVTCDEINAPKTFEELMNDYYSVKIISEEGVFEDYHYE
jgi:hypothetical protein